MGVPEHLWPEGVEGRLSSVQYASWWSHWLLFSFIALYQQYLESFLVNILALLCTLTWLILGPVGVNPPDEKQAGGRGRAGGRGDCVWPASRHGEGGRRAGECLTHNIGREGGGKFAV